jgi:hypothetical protein
MLCDCKAGIAGRGWKSSIRHLTEGVKWRMVWDGVTGQLLQQTELLIFDNHRIPLLPFVRSQYLVNDWLTAEC